MKEKKRKPGRPKTLTHKEFKSISVPKDVWDELDRQAKHCGWTIGKVATNRIKSGTFNPTKDTQDDGVEL